jgi:hypothetical protein
MIPAWTRDSDLVQALARYPIGGGGAGRQSVSAIRCQCGADGSDGVERNPAELFGERDLAKKRDLAEKQDLAKKQDLAEKRNLAGK